MKVIFLTTLGILCMVTLTSSKREVENDLPSDESKGEENVHLENSVSEEDETSDEGEDLQLFKESSELEGSNRMARQQRGCAIHYGNITTTGFCVVRRACVNYGGQIAGRCGPRGNVCCYKEKRCSQATALNDTIFLNLGYPEPDSGTGACTLTINRLNTNICQMRFQFVTLELSQPDSDGSCVTDFLTVTGGTNASPIICGSNTGQHMYVDVDPQGGAVRLTVDRTAASMSERMWKVIVSQIECTSKFRAPAGCLQYFTETSGTVSSFNFDQTIDENAVPATTRQIVNMNYAVCVQMADGYCSIMWSRNTTDGDYGFTVSSNIAGIARDLIGDPASSSTSEMCQTDYVVIPGAVDGLGSKNDRFCGAGFPNFVTSSFRPFIMYVSTNDNEIDDVLNRGFRLDYRQTIC